MDCKVMWSPGEPQRDAALEIRDDVEQWSVCWRWRVMIAKCHMARSILERCKRVCNQRHHPIDMPQCLYGTCTLCPRRVLSSRYDFWGATILSKAIATAPF